MGGRSRSSRRLGSGHVAHIGTVLLCLVAVVALPAAATGAAGRAHASESVSATPLTWLAAGDSYSSGRGLSGAVGPCARGDAYPIQAYDDLRRVMTRLKDPIFTACSGAVTANFFGSGDAEHRPEWRPAGTRYDLVTFTLGGDTVDFSGVIAQCVLGALEQVHASAPGHKCPEDTWVRRQIAQRLGSPYVAFLRHLAGAAVVPRGNVVVLGYPDLMAAPTSWPRADRSADSCQGITEADARQLRSEAEDLNGTLAHDVAVVNAAHPNGVHLSFLPVNTGGQTGPVVTPRDDPYLFEPKANGSHDLCGSGDAWLNGVDLQDLDRSFHPDLPGNVAEGHLLAQVLPHLEWP